MRRLLVANRGEIARRVLRSAHALGLSTVAVYTADDADAPHVREADRAVELLGTTTTETWLDPDRLVAAARLTDADAVHPGYGFLSEDAGFARACAAAGLVFVGPSPEVIAAMGSKVAARERLAAVGVPILPGATVGDEPDDDLVALAEDVGFPLVVKPVFGGGGRGLRAVHHAADLAGAVAAARREAGTAFGDDTVFLERFVVDPRHVEVQIVGDRHGRVVHLFERECSIQRRHQKVVEEAPSPAVDADLRRRLGEVAVTAGEAIGYVGAGTVEFVLEPDGAFHFLEVNTRLQVEHPVTEQVTGLDLVAWQLRIADGARIEELLDGHEPSLAGHAIEARLYAEDPARDYAPTTGTLSCFEVAIGPGVRLDSGVERGSVVGTAYDGLLAKVIAHGPTRHVAVRRLRRALRASRIHGLVTNRDLLVHLLGDDEFLAATTDTGWLRRHPPADLAARHGMDRAAVHRCAMAAVLAGRARNRSRARTAPSLPAGWRNVPTPGAAVRLRHDDRVLEIVVDDGCHRDRLEVRIDDEAVADLQVVAVEPDLVDLVVGGQRLRLRVRHDPGVVHVDGPDGSVTFERLGRFPDPHLDGPSGSLRTPLPGAVVRVAVAEADRVAAGQVLVVLEAMKMEHDVVAPHDGVVTAVNVSPGDQVAADAVVAVVTGDDRDGSGAADEAPAAGAG